MPFRILYIEKEQQEKSFNGNILVSIFHYGIRKQRSKRELQKGMPESLTFDLRKHEKGQKLQAV